MNIIFWFTFIGGIVVIFGGRAAVESDLRTALVALGLAAATISFPHLGVPGRRAVGGLSLVIGVLVLILGVPGSRTPEALCTTAAGLVLIAASTNALKKPEKETSLLDWARSED